MKIEKIYRLALDEYDTPTTDFYTKKQSALEQLNDFKEMVKEEYIDNEQIDVGAMILLQTIDLNKSEDLYMFAISRVVSESVIDKNGLMVWKDYEVE